MSYADAPYGVAWWVARWALTDVQVGDPQVRTTGAQADLVGVRASGFLGQCR